jgi:pyridoxamine 5'-phosphate oxidase
MDKTIVKNLRKSYSLHYLLEENVPKNPFELFKLWFSEALAGDVKEPNAMVLSTINQGKPAARVVLLKGIEEGGFSFYTNYHSHKGQQLVENPFASLTFFWDGLERQVRIEGEIDFLSDDESDAYFWSRPRESQIGAWVSQQSAEIVNRQVLEDSLRVFEEKFKEMATIPRPPHWGGYLLRPSQIEFWQGRPSRLHDRLLYTLREANSWMISRLSP